MNAKLLQCAIWLQNHQTEYEIVCHCVRRQRGVQWKCPNHFRHFHIRWKCSLYTLFSVTLPIVKNSIQFESEHECTQFYPFLYAVVSSWQTETNNCHGIFAKWNNSNVLLCQNENVPQNIIRIMKIKLLISSPKYYFVSIHEMASSVC